MKKPDFEKAIGKLWEEANRFHKDGVNPTPFTMGAKAIASQIWADYVEPLQQRLDQAEKERDEFALGFHRWWESALMAGDYVILRSTKDLLSEYKQTLKSKQDGL